MDFTEAEAPIWREAVRLNKSGIESERLLAYAALCEMYGNKMLDEALDNASRIYDPSSCFYNLGGWFAVAAALRSRAAEAKAIERKAADEACYQGQFATVNAQRTREGKEPLTYSQFMAGAD